MADISKITLPDGSEYNIKDAGALRIDGTAVAAQRIVRISHLDSTGWYKFFEFTLPGNNSGYGMTFIIKETYASDNIGIINFYINFTSDGSPTVYFNNIATTMSANKLKYKLDGYKITLYYNKATNDVGDTNFSLITSHARNGNYWDTTSCWMAVLETPDSSAVDITTTIQNKAQYAVSDANGDQIDTTYLKKTETAHSSYTLFPTKVYPGSLVAGWYKFAEVNIPGTSGRAKITFKYGAANSSFDFIGDIFVYKERSIPMNCSMQIPYSVAGKTTYFRYNIDSSTTVSFYVYKHDSGGYPVFTILTSQDALGDYLDPSTYMLESLVAETPPATALKPLYSAINRWIYNVPVSPGTNQQILSYSHNMITSASVLAKIEFSNPDYIKSDCSWETSDGTNPNDAGTITLTGTCTTATTANLLLLNVVEG